MSGPHESQTYYPQLNGLRAFAVTTVLIGHLVPLSKLQNLVSNGDIGVVVFFCLSGFLITGILLRSRDDVGAGTRQKITNFYIRRTLRIFPIYYLSLFVMLAWGYPPAVDNAICLLTYSLNIPYVSTTGSLGAATHFWSLHVEEQFYFAWPFIVMFCPPRHLHRVLIVLIAASLSYKLACALTWISGYPFRPLIGCVDSLGLGALLACSIHERKEAVLRRLLWISRLALPVVCVLLPVRMYLKIDPWFFSNIIFGVVMFSMISFSSIQIIYESTRNEDGFLSKIFMNKWIQYIGTISYGIYVYHFFTPSWVESIPLPAMSRLELTAVKVVLELGLTFLVSGLSYRYLERPLLSLKPSLR